MRGSSRPPEAAGVQNSVFTAEQARGAGYSAKQVRHRLRSGQWTVVLGSVYADRSAPLTAVSLARAAALAAGTGAVVSHTTCAVLCDLKVPRDPEAHVIVDPERRLRIPGLRPHRVELAESEIVVVDGIACTSLLRTALDCLLWLPEEAGRAMAVDAVRRGRLTVDELRTTLRRAGQRHGLGRAWSVVADIGAGAHSEAEVRAHTVLRRAGLGGWTANVPILDADGLIGIVDVLFAEARVIVEIDGRAYHSDDIAFQRDRTRQNRLIGAGYRVLRFTWGDVVARPDEVVRLVRQALAARGSGSRPQVRGA
jgi:hypothetical protein